MSAQDRVIVSLAVIEPFVFGLILGLFAAGMIYAPLFGNVDSLLALRIVGGLWGGLIVAASLAFALWSYSRYAARVEGSLVVSHLWPSYAACTALTLAVKVLSAAAGLAVITGFFAVFSLNIREAMHLSMEASIAIMVVGIVGLLSFVVLPQLALNFTAVSSFTVLADEFVYNELCGAMCFSGPMSIVAAALIIGRAEAEDQGRH